MCTGSYKALLALKPWLKLTPHNFCIDIPADLTIESNLGGLGQLLINLIMNSAHHAFAPGTDRRITIKANNEYDSANNKKLVFIYQDNGMATQTIENIYKPFYTLAR
jgi:C4-dicarboxylate-specific signal transduction histidine kinase